MAPRRFGSGLRGLLVPLPLLLLLLLGPWPAAGHGGKYSRERNEPEWPPKREPGGEFRMEKLNQLWEKAQRVRLFPTRVPPPGPSGGRAGGAIPALVRRCHGRGSGRSEKTGTLTSRGVRRGAACVAASRPSIAPPCEVARFLFGRRTRKSCRRDRGSQGYFCPALWAGGFLGCCKTAEQRRRAPSLALWGLGEARGGWREGSLKGASVDRARVRRAAVGVGPSSAQGHRVLVSQGDNPSRPARCRCRHSRTRVREPQVLVRVCVLTG